MGIWVIIKIDVICDTCKKVIAQMRTAKSDVPAYERCEVICDDCMLSLRDEPGLVEQDAPTDQA